MGQKITYLDQQGLLSKTLATTTSVLETVSKMIQEETSSVYESMALWCARASMAGFCFASPYFGAPTSTVVD
jgi:hypothetical protein